MNYSLFDEEDLINYFVNLYKDKTIPLRSLYKVILFHYDDFIDYCDFLEILFGTYEIYDLGRGPFLIR